MSVSDGARGADLSLEDAMILRAALALLAEDVVEQETDRSVLRVYEVGVLRDESGPALEAQAERVVSRARQLVAQLDDSRELAGLSEGQWPACLRPYAI